MLLLYLSNFPENFSLLPGQKLTFFGKILRKVTENHPKNQRFMGIFGLISSKNDTFEAARTLKFSGKLDTYKRNIFPNF